MNIKNKILPYETGSDEYTKMYKSALSLSTYDQLGSLLVAVKRRNDTFNVSLYYDQFYDDVYARVYRKHLNIWK